jgi:hypothetical protein
MIYGLIPDWMIAENPAFAAAVADYYSIPDGKGATYGDLRWWVVSGRFLANLEARRESWGEQEYRWHLETTAHIHQLEVQVTQAVWRRDTKWLRRLVTRMEQLNEELKSHGEYQLSPLECVFAAYVFLRKREGKNSLLPVKKEVKMCAALIQAFAACNLMAKLPKFLWGTVSTIPLDGPKPTDSELDRILQLQAEFVRPELESSWTYRLNKAGLGRLRQERPDALE